MAGGKRAGRKEQVMGTWKRKGDETGWKTKNDDSWYKKGDQITDDTTGGQGNMPNRPNSVKDEHGNVRSSHHGGGMWPGGIVANYKGYDIEATYDGGGHLWYRSAYGCVGKTVGDVETCLDKYTAQQNQPPAPGEKPQPPSGSGSGGGGTSWERSGGYSGVPGESWGTGYDVSSQQPSQPQTQPAQPAVPDWMQERMQYWDEKQKQLLDAARATFQWSGQQYTKAWSAVGTQYREAAKNLQTKYGQALGMLAQGQSQQQSALARYAATGRMSGGSAEQAMQQAARESAKGAMGAYEAYASGRAALADTAIRSYAVLGAEVGKYTQMVVEAMRAVPNPYEDWANFMNGLVGYSGVAV